MRWIQGAAAALAAAIVVGCGGGGKGGGDAGTDPNAPTAADLSLTLDSPSVFNTGSQSVGVSVVAVDGSRVALPQVAVQMSVDNGAVVQMSSATTDDSGEVKGTVRIGSDRSNRVITVTASSGGITRTASFQVTGAKLQATLEPAIVAPGDSGKITYRLVDNNSNPMAGQEISVSAPGLPDKTGTTNANGTYVYKYKAPSSTGNIKVAASAGGDDDEQTLLVQAGDSAIDDVPAGSVRSASISANPSVVPINTDATNNETSIRALFVGKNNKPIKNVRVRFDLNGDPNSVGGKISSGKQTVYSDSNGQAIASYIPGSRFSPSDGVEVRACWDYTQFDAGTCPNEVVTTLTVVSEPLSVMIGDTNKLEEDSRSLLYRKYFLVQVVDSSGVAKSGVKITPSVILTQYRKGAWGVDPADTSLGWQQVVRATCYNEDTNLNGIMEASENDGQPNLVDGVIVEDNANGQLDPREADVAISVVGSDRTDASGQVTLKIEYSKNRGSWVRYKILAAASGVAGTEGRDTFERWTDVVSEDTGDSNVRPPFDVSPYGTANSCANPN